MSGRVNVTLEDGRQVRGYRKTLRINQRRTPEERLHVLNARRAQVHKSEWRVRVGFNLPKGTLVSNGPHGIGVHVYHGFVHVCGTNSTECFVRAVEFMRGIGLHLWPYRTLCSVIALDQPGRHYMRYLSITDQPAITFCGGAVTPLVF